MKNIFNLIVIISIFSACNKDNRITISSVVSAEDNSLIESEFISIYDIAQDVISNNLDIKNSSKLLPKGVLLLFTDSLYSDGNGLDFKLDFGDVKREFPNGILCLDGRYRAGILHFKTNKKYEESGFFCEILANELDSFFAGNDGGKLSLIFGKKIISRVNNSTFNILVENGKIKNENGTISWNCDRTVELLRENNPVIMELGYQVTGVADGINRNGEIYTATIEEPLIKKSKRDCLKTYIIGTIKLTDKKANNKITIDYDPFNNKDCDLVIKATLKSKEFFFDLK